MSKFEFSFDSKIGLKSFLNTDLKGITDQHILLSIGSCTDLGFTDTDEHGSRNYLLHTPRLNFERISDFFSDSAWNNTEEPIIKILS